MLTLSSQGVNLRRHGLSFILGVDLVVMAAWDHRYADPDYLTPPQLASSLADGSWHAVALLPGLPWIVAAIGLASLVSHARRPASMVGGLVAVLCGGLLFAIHEYVRGQNDESHILSGAMMVGWVGGVLFARLVGVRGAPVDIDRYGAIGAGAMIGAAYFNAGLSKLLVSGVGWADPRQIQTFLGAFVGTGEPELFTSLRFWALGSTFWCATFAWATLICELGGVLFPFGYRLRLLAGTGILVFHAGDLVFSNIIFAQPVVLIILFTYPWERLLWPSKVAAVRTPARLSSTRRAWGGAAAMVALVVGLVSLSWAAPIGAMLDHEPHPVFAGVFERVRQHNSWALGAVGGRNHLVSVDADRLGPVTLDEDLGGGWRMGRIELASEDTAVLTLRSADGGEVVCLLLGPDPDGYRPAFPAGGLLLFEQRPTLPFEAFAEPLERVANALAGAVGTREPGVVLGEWIRDAPRSRPETSGASEPIPTGVRVPRTLLPPEEETTTRRRTAANTSDHPQRSPGNDRHEQDHE